MRQLWALPVVIASVATCHAGSVERDRHMDRYLAIWASDANVTPATVGRLYGDRVDYYGTPMSAVAVYRDKLAFIRRWPRRRYGALPGTVTNDCSERTMRCRVTAVLRWSRADGAGRHGEQGTNTVRLDLVRQGGELKIVRESGAPLGARR